MPAEIIELRHPLKVDKPRLATRLALFKALLEFAETGGTRAEVRKSIQLAFSDAELMREDAEVGPLR